MLVVLIEPKLCRQDHAVLSQSSVSRSDHTRWKTIAPGHNMKLSASCMLQHRLPASIPALSVTP